MSPDVDARWVPEAVLLCVERVVSGDTVPDAIRDISLRIYGHIEQAGIPTPDEMIVMYHGAVSPDGTRRMEVCVELAGDVEPFEGARVRREPAHREAFTRLTKSEMKMPDVMEAFDAVGAWIEASGSRVAGSPREVYLDDWDALGDDDPACDVVIPIE